MVPHSCFPVLSPGFLITGTALSADFLAKPTVIVSCIEFASFGILLKLFFSFGVETEIGLLLCVLLMNPNQGRRKLVDSCLVVGSKRFLCKANYGYGCIYDHK